MKKSHIKPMTEVLSREVLARARENAQSEPTPVIPSMTELESRLLELRVELADSIDAILQGMIHLQNTLWAIVDELKEAN